MTDTSLPKHSQDCPYFTSGRQCTCGADVRDMWQIALGATPRCPDCGKALVGVHSCSPQKTDAEILSSQVAQWRKEVARLNDLIATAEPEQRAERDEDIARAFDILNRLCDKGLLSMSVPMRDSDEDMVLSRIIKRAALSLTPADTLHGAIDHRQERALRAEEALREIAEMTYDAWTNGARAGEIARAAIKEQS